MLACDGEGANNHRAVARVLFGPAIAFERYPTLSAFLHSILNVGIVFIWQYVDSPKA